MLVVSSCANSGAPETSTDNLTNNINHALENGKTVVVYQMKNNNTTTEQYEDWSAYLNDFSSKHSATYAFFKANSDFNKRLVLSGLPHPGNYTVFVKKNKPVYFYDGVIVEAMVYLAVDTAYSTSALSPMHEAFLPNKIDLKQNKN